MCRLGWPTVFSRRSAPPWGSKVALNTGGKGAPPRLVFRTQVVVFRTQVAVFRTQLIVFRTQLVVFNCVYRWACLVSVCLVGVLAFVSSDVWTPYVPRGYLCLACVSLCLNVCSAVFSMRVKSHGPVSVCA